MVPTPKKKTIPIPLKTGGLTLLEVMVVIIIISLVAVFAIPQYHKSMERTYLQEAMNQLRLLHEAENVYFARTGNYWPNAGPQDLDAINNNLNLGIAANGFQYACTFSAAPNFYSCIAYRPTTAGFRYRVTVTGQPLSGSNPGCSAGTESCP